MSQFFRKLCIKLAVAAGLGVIAIAPAMATKRNVGITAIEPKGGVTIEKEPVPNTPLPEGNGYLLKKPDQLGRREVSVYVFDPRQVLINKGDEVTLESWASRVPAIQSRSRTTIRDSSSSVAIRLV